MSGFGSDKCSRQERLRWPFGCSFVSARTHELISGVRHAISEKRQKRKLTVYLFDHRVGTGDQPCGYFEAKLLRRLEVDDQFPVGFLKIWHLCWVTAVENFNDLRGCSPKARLYVEGVGHQRTGLGRLGIKGDGRKTVLLRQSTQQVTMRVIL